MKTLLATALLLLMPILAYATTYHTRLMALFDAPDSTSTLYLATKLNNDPVRAWLFGDGQHLDFEYTPQPPEEPAPVPEPSTCLLMIAGIALVISVSRSSCRRSRA